MNGQKHDVDGQKQSRMTLLCNPGRERIAGDEVIKTVFGDTIQSLRVSKVETTKKKTGRNDMGDG